MGDGPSKLPNADYKSRSQAIASIAEKFECSRDRGQSWVNKQAVAEGNRDGLTRSERDEFKALQRENRELKQAKEILRKGEAFVRLFVVAPSIQARWATANAICRVSG